MICRFNICKFVYLPKFVSPKPILRHFYSYPQTHICMEQWKIRVPWAHIPAEVEQDDALLSHFSSLIINEIIFAGQRWWLSVICLKCRRRRFDPWVRKIPWRREWQPSKVFLLGKPHRQRSLAGYNPWGHKRVEHDLATKQQEQSFLQSI